MLDLGSNLLWGPLPRIFVQGACLWQEVWLGFKAGGNGLANDESMVAGLDGLPWWSFYGNLGLQVSVC